MTRSHVEGLQLDRPLGGGTLMFLLPVPGGGVMILHTEVTIVINNSIFHSISWTNSDNGVGLQIHQPNRVTSARGKKCQEFLAGYSLKVAPAGMQGGGSSAEQLILAFIKGWGSQSPPPLLPLGGCRDESRRPVWGPKY